MKALVRRRKPPRLAVQPLTVGTPRQSGGCSCRGVLAGTAPVPVPLRHPASPRLGIARGRCLATLGGERRLPRGKDRPSASHHAGRRWAGAGHDRWEPWSGLFMATFLLPGSPSKAPAPSSNPRRGPQGSRQHRQQDKPPGTVPGVGADRRPAAASPSPRAGNAHHGYPSTGGGAALSEKKANTAF